MRILVDYRPALRHRTGVGEYMHELAHACARAGRDDISVFTSSWADRPPSSLSAELGARVIDQRVPVRLLNRLWHRAEWPPVEWLAGPCDVVQAAHPLLIPTRAAAQVVTIHDLFFLDQPEMTSGEIRRDYVPLTGAHARRADAVITVSNHVGRQIVDRLGVPADRVHVCPPGAPRWVESSATSAGRGGGGGGADRGAVSPRGHVLFVGTLEPRKNLGVLLDAWEQLLAGGGLTTVDGRPAPLRLAGRPGRGSEPWLARIAAAPLAPHVVIEGYVPDERRAALFAGARLLVLPSLDEGFGLPALEAMAAGLPVVASTRGSLPEVIGDAGVLIEPGDAAGFAAAIRRIWTDDAWAAELSARGLARAATFTWERTAQLAHDAWASALERRRARQGGSR